MDMSEEDKMAWRVWAMEQTVQLCMERGDVDTGEMLFLANMMYDWAVFAKADKPDQPEPTVLPDPVESPPSQPVKYWGDNA